jgi:hypothetical protein
VTRKLRGEHKTHIRRRKTRENWNGLKKVRRFDGGLRMQRSGLDPICGSQSWWPLAPPTWRNIGELNTKVRGLGSVAIRQLNEALHELHAETPTARQL